MSKYLYVGVEPPIVSDLESLFETAKEHQFDFIVCDLAHPRHQRQLLTKLTDDQPPFTRSDLILTSQQWSSFIVGKLSSWISPDSNCVATRQLAEKTIEQELQWAAHLNLPAVILPSLSPPFENYARTIFRNVSKMSFGQLWLRLPILVENSEENFDTWDWWHQIRSMANYSSRLFLCLEISSDLPDSEYLDRWFGEPVRAIVLSTNCFLTNKAGFPVLGPAHRSLVLKFAKLKLQFIISGKTHYENQYFYYKKYLSHLATTQPMSPQEAFESPYYDYLQSPLQPLMDNLESQTYEVFEKDPVKYKNYQEAVRLALLERLDKPITLMVLGAGRGPLVTAALNATAEANHKRVNIYAVEKNPNAVVTLRNKKLYYGWEDKVTIIDCDMRFWEPPELADIIVSELLGSFGDNELSPECLDGAQRFLKPDGISIPVNYISFLSPVSTPKLWIDIMGTKDDKQFEIPYVVKVFNAYIIAPPKPVFEFVHPNRAPIIDNSRYIKLSFTAKIDTVLHGFVGYFTSNLYKEVDISIHPDTFSDGMFSWFPIFFPIRNPIKVTGGEEIEIEMWRVCTDKKVWYEWAVTKPKVSYVHNIGGWAYYIGL